MVGPRLGKGCRPLVYNIAHKIVSGSSQHAMVPEMGQEMNKKELKINELDVVVIGDPNWA